MGVELDDIGWSVWEEEDEPEVVEEGGDDNVEDEDEDGPEIVEELGLTVVRADDEGCPVDLIWFDVSSSLFMMAR